ncbi:serine/threonine-protein kinase [Streptomyces candidus]|uniref:non-specific serine/threonine protein kinase n=1 Tax=Streptomyces candidus TaxID=67283 RepID=A0A7X0HEC8_9ACTN|nr:serine/threonine-protein kinase [Streptomyces candidus]MBB6435993.1 serine/threonine protein kinase [Streptomyces candidus]
MASRCSTEVLGGRYRLDEPIGSGGAADVHRGLDLRLGRPVAVKVFRPDSGVDIEEESRREAVLLAHLHHPGLVSVYDAGQDKGHAFLVLELIEGSTLRSRIEQGALPVAETAALGADLAGALGHAHAAGVVHRDVKPSNILLDASGRPHLTDFGISRLLDTTSRTATGTLIGTAAYLSPEQVLGQRVGRAADIYALGLVILECLTGRPEYDGGPLEAAIARLHRAPALPGHLPEQLQRLLRDMTALDGHDRPDAHECADALAALTGSAAPEGATPDSGPPLRVTSLCAPAEPPRTADRTHPKPPGDAGRTSRRARAARARPLVAGAAALTAVLATALTLTDSPPVQKGQDAARTPVATPPATHRTPAGPPPGTAPVRSTRPSPTGPQPSAPAPVSMNKTVKAPSGSLNSPAAPPRRTASAPPASRPDSRKKEAKTAEKAEKAENKAERKEAKKAAKR